MPGGVGRGGGADVAAFDVTDDDQAQFGGFLDEAEICFDAFLAELFEIGGLELHAGDARGDDAHPVARIHDETSRVAALVVKTNEELAIAQQTGSVVRAALPAEAGGIPIAVSARHA